MRSTRFALQSVFLLHVGCGAPEEAPQKETPRPVRTSQVETKASASAIWLPGRAEATEAPDLSFRVGGRIERLVVDIGDEVQAGQLVATLEREDYQARASQAEAEVARARAEAERTKREAQRAQALFEGEATSEANRDQTRELAEAAAAQLEAAEQRQKIALRELGYTQLRAPQAGVVVERRAEPGVNVAAGQAILSASSRKVEVRVDVPDTLISSIAVGSTALVRKAGAKTEEASAKILRAARASTERSSLYPVILQTDHLRLVPGMAVEVRLEEADSGDDFLVVPSTAVVANQRGAFVWTLVDAADLKGDEPFYKANALQVQFSHMEGGEAFLTGGVRPKQRVVTAGARYLKEGMVVREARLPPLVPEAGLPVEPVFSRTAHGER
ncbi:MAG: efflux RND transporter periplasmic adaptor subunit [Myxococcota bacterium]